jgi:hypothetical protein
MTKKSATPIHRSFSGCGIRFVHLQGCSRKWRWVKKDPSAAEEQPWFAWEERLAGRKKFISDYTNLSDLISELADSNRLEEAQHL